MPKAKAAVKPLSVPLTPELLSYVIEQARESMRTPEAQVAWWIRCMAENEPIGAPREVWTPYEPQTGAGAAPVVAQSPTKEVPPVGGITPYPQLDAAPEGPVTYCRRIGGFDQIGPASWGMEGPKSSLFKVDAEWHRDFEANRQHDGFKAIGEHGGYVYYRGVA